MPSQLSDDEQDDLDLELLEECNFARPENIRELLGQGANPNRSFYVSADESSNPMLEAAKSGCKETVLELTQAGGRFDLVNSQGLSPLQGAVLATNEMFCIWMANLPQCVAAARRQEIPDVQEILDLACSYGMAEFVQTISDLGYLHPVTVDRINQSLTHAAMAKSRACMEVLLHVARKEGFESQIDLVTAFYRGASELRGKTDFLRWMLEETDVRSQLLARPDVSPVKVMLEWDLPVEAMMLIEEEGFAKPDAHVLEDLLIESVRQSHLGSVQLLLDWDVDRVDRFKDFSLLQIARREPVRRLLRSRRTQLLLEEAMGGDQALSAQGFGASPL